MLILGIILVISAIVVFRFVASGLNKPFIDRPMLFNNGGMVLFLHLVWSVLLILGLYVLWKVNYSIVLILVGLYAILWILGYLMGSKKSKAKKIFKIYKQVKLYRPELDTIAHYRHTASTYYESLRWDERRVRMTVETIFESKSAEDTNIKDVAKSILNFENPGETFGRNFDFKKYVKQSAKEQEAIETAYKQILGDTESDTGRPELSKHALIWIESAGLNPDEMSDEQVRVFAEIDDHGKSNFFVRACYGIATASLFLAIFSLITFDLWGLGIYLTMSIILWFIGNKIQLRRISKKFHEASIQRYAREKAVNK